jgi:NADH:ubiquinone oxidoreductase subunit 2 (subunit N)
MSAAVASEQWWLAAVLMVGGLLTAVYVFRVISGALRTPATPLVLAAPVARSREMATLAMALASVLLGLVALFDLQGLAGGRPLAGG